MNDLSEKLKKECRKRDFNHDCCLDKYEHDHFMVCFYCQSAYEIDTLRAELAEAKAQLEHNDERA